MLVHTSMHMCLYVQQSYYKTDCLTYNIGCRAEPEYPGMVHAYMIAILILASLLILNDSSFHSVLVNLLNNQLKIYVLSISF
jgi:hypothetical protein